MTSVKYKAGDIVHVRLDAPSAASINEDDVIYLDDDMIIAHIPAPEPVVRWVNVYDGENFEHESRESAMCNRVNLRLHYLFTARLEWPDGDTSKKPIVTVEDV